MAKISWYDWIALVFAFIGGAVHVWDGFFNLGSFTVLQYLPFGGIVQGVAGVISIYILIKLIVKIYMRR